jgi:hypothetical protein
MRIGEPRFGGGDKAIGNKGSMLARKMANYSGISRLVLPRERKRILSEFITMRNVKRRGEGPPLTDPIGSEYLRNFQHLGLIRLQIGEGDRAIRRTEVDAETETFGHELWIFSCTLRLQLARSVSQGDVGSPTFSAVVMQLTSVRFRQAQLSAAGRGRSARGAEGSPSRFSSRDGGASPRTLLAR